MLQVATEQDCRIVPRLALPAVPTVAAGKRLWEMTEWMPGVPATQDATLQHVHAGAAAIGRFHRSVRPLGVSYGPAPAVDSRLQRCREIRDAIPVIVNRPRFSSGHHELDLAVDRAGQLLRANWTEVDAKITRSLRRYDGLSVPTQYVLRDVHQDHVLFEATRVVGLIDFDAIRVDTPMTDLARWVGGFEQFPETDLWTTAMAGYQQNSPFPQEETEDFRGAELGIRLAFATKWISLANWVIWLAIEKRSFPAAPFQLANRVAKWVRSCDPGDLGGVQKH